MQLSSRNVRTSARSILAASLWALILVNTGVSQVGRRTQIATGGIAIDTATKRPVVGAAVYLIRGAYPGLPDGMPRYLPLRTPEYPHTVTDQRGRFSFRVPVGERVAFFAHKDERMSLVSPTVAAGSFVRLSVRGSRVVKGVFRDRGNKQPIPGHTVYVFVPANENLRFGMQFQVKTDKAGRYEARVPLGTWVRIQARDQRSWFTRDVHGDNVHDFLIGRAPGDLRGVILDSDSRPVPGCVVMDSFTPRIHSTTDDVGAFTLTGVSGARDVIVMGPGNHASRSIVGQPNPKTRLVTDGNGLRFRLVDERGLPLRRTMVVIAGVSSWFRSTGSTHGKYLVPRFYRTDEHGEVEVFCRKNCRYLSAFVEMDGRFVWFYRGAPAKGGKGGIIPIVPRARLSGRISGPDRVPLEQTTVHLARLPDDRSVILPAALFMPIVNLPLTLTCTSDSAGRFFFPGLQPGRYCLVIRPSWGLGFSKVVTIGVKDQFCELRFPTGRAVGGTVVDHDGWPVAGAIVTVHVTVLGGGPERKGEVQGWVARRFAGYLLELRTDSSGRFRGYNLPTNSRILFRVKTDDGNSKWSKHKLGAKIDKMDLSLVLKAIR